MAKYAIKNLNYADSKLLVKYEYAEEGTAYCLNIIRYTGDVNVLFKQSICGKYDWWALSKDSFWKDRLSIISADLFEFEDDESAILAFEVM